MPSGQTVLLSGPANRSLAKRLIDCAPAGAVLNIREARRTNDQNALMWALLSDLSRAKPEGRAHTPEVWKQLMMHALGHSVQFEMGLNGQPFPTGFHSSRLNKADMGALLDTIYEYAARHGVRFSDELEKVA